MWKCGGKRKPITLIVLRSRGYEKVILLSWKGPQRRRHFYCEEFEDIRL